MLSLISWWQPHLEPRMASQIVPISSAVHRSTLARDSSSGSRSKSGVISLRHKCITSYSRKGHRLSVATHVVNENVF